MKWWLVSEDVLTEVRFILGLAIKDSGQTEWYKNAFRDALHSLETGMHKTDAVPADFSGPTPAHDSRERARTIGDDAGNEKGE